MLSVPLDAELESRLSAIAARSGEAPDAIARAALLAYLEDLEDYAVAIEAAREADLDPSKRVSLEEMKRALGMDA